MIDKPRRHLLVTIDIGHAGYASVTVDPTRLDDAEVPAMLLRAVEALNSMVRDYDERGQ